METTTLLTAAVLFLCAFLRSALGFGDALLAIPLLGMFMSLTAASPIADLAGIVMSLSILAGDRENVVRGSAWRLIAGSIAGIPLGVLLLSSAPERLVKAVLGVILVLYGVGNLIAPGVRRLRNERLAFPFGFAAGILGGAYNTSGPPVVVYGSLREWSPAQLRATLQLFFVFTYGATAVGYAFADLWTSRVFELFLWSFPAICAGVYLGGKLHSRIPGRVFHRVILLVLVFLGIVLLV